MKLFIFFVLALTVLASENFLSDTLEKLIEERLAERKVADHGDKMNCPHIWCYGGGRRQLSRESRLSDILEKLIEERVAERKVADHGDKMNCPHIWCYGD